MTTNRNAVSAERADRKVSNTVNQKRDSWPMRLVGAASDIGDQPQMRLLCAATIALAVARRDGRLAEAGFKMLAAHTLATWAKSGVKAVVNRTRPDSGNDPKVELGDSDAHEENSFPSGHSAGVIAVAEAFVRVYPEHAIVARSAACTVAAVQVPRGTHYAGDVIVGGMLGVFAEQASDQAWGAALSVLERRIRSNR